MIIPQKGRFNKLVSAIDVWTVVDLLIIINHYNYRWHFCMSLLQCKNVFKAIITLNYGQFKEH